MATISKEELQKLYNILDLMSGIRVKNIRYVPDSKIRELLAKLVVCDSK